LATKYLWRDASPSEKNALRKLMEDVVRVKFEKFYRSDEGGFSLYSGSKHADLDGTGGVVNLFDEIGALSREKQMLLWGPPEKNMIDLGSYELSELKEIDIALLKKIRSINSVRLYQSDSAANIYKLNAVGIAYLKRTSALDVLDMLPKLRQFVDNTSQNYGNWISKDMIRQELGPYNIRAIPTFDAKTYLQFANEIFHKKGMLILIGFDIIGAPVCKIKYATKKCP
jgi:hypothetical protein